MMKNENPLKINEIGIAQAGSIAFSISSREVEPTYHALEQLIERWSHHGKIALRRHAEKCGSSPRSRCLHNESGQERAGAVTTSRATLPANSRCRCVGLTDGA